MQPRYRLEAPAGVDNRTRQLPLRTTSRHLVWADVASASRAKQHFPAHSKVGPFHGERERSGVARGLDGKQGLALPPLLVGSPTTGSV
jgi:hypothetical protein